MNHVEKLIELIAEVLDMEPEELSADVGPNQIEEWDSVNALRILTHIETEWGVRLTMEEYAQAQTIGDLAELIAGSVAHGAHS
jgi:acyl carrier protein